MPDWQQTRYQGIDSNLLQQLANSRSKKAAGLDAFNQSSFFPQANQGFNTLGQAMQRQKQKQQWQQTINGLMQNPNINPQLKSMLPMIAQQPELMGQIGPELLKSQQPRPEWSAVSGMTDKQGNPIEIDKFTGQMKPVPIPGGTKSTGYGSTMGPIRQAQYTIQDLPSNQGPSTAGGAAYQVLVGSQQGMNLIARAGSTQRTGLAQADLARSVIRSTPTDEALKNANFSDNFITKVGQLRQRITADPTALSNPQIRKEMYTIFKEMRESSRPFIQNQLDDMSDAGFPVTPNTRKRQLGDTLPVIPFQEGTSTGTANSGGGWSYVGQAQ